MGAEEATLCSFCVAPQKFGAWAFRGITLDGPIAPLAAPRRSRSAFGDAKPTPHGRAIGHPAETIGTAQGLQHPTHSPPMLLPPPPCPTRHPSRPVRLPLPHSSRAVAVAGKRGFTLLEAMAVVTIIGLLSAAALPSFIERMRERRSSQAAEEIAILYRSARSRSLGRGAAQMIEIAPASGGGMNVVFRVREAIQQNNLASTVGTCGPLPMTSCFNDWSDGATGKNRLVDEFPKEASLYAKIEAKLLPSSTDASAVESGQVCFTPSGRTFFRASVDAVWTPLIDVPRIQVRRKDFDGSSYIGLTRTVILPPSGAARLAL
jgi:prepilin-type N-terminal cleavage/methylation domain-containing protein